MTTPDIRLAMQVPGRLCFTPTDLSADYPHGGTGLGIVHQQGVMVDAPVQVVRAEEWGREPVEVVSGGEAISLVGLLRSWDADALGKLYLNTSTGTVTGHAVVDFGGTNRAGYHYGARSVVLVFSPDNIDRHPMVIFYKAIPMPREQHELSLRLRSNLEVPYVFLGVRDGSGRVAKVGMRADLSL